jgi:hypothetical protein
VPPLTPAGRDLIVLAHEASWYLPLVLEKRVEKIERQARAMVLAEILAILDREHDQPIDGLRQRLTGLEVQP